jgi:hypothetical protein
MADDKFSWIDELGLEPIQTTETPLPRKLPVQPIDSDEEVNDFDWIDELGLAPETTQTEEAPEEFAPAEETTTPTPEPEPTFEPEPIDIPEGFVVDQKPDGSMFIRSQGRVYDDLYIGKGKKPLDVINKDSEKVLKYVSIARNALDNLDSLVVQQTDSNMDQIIDNNGRFVAYIEEDETMVEAIQRRIADQSQRLQNYLVLRKHFSRDLPPEPEYPPLFNDAGVETQIVNILNDKNVNLSELYLRNDDGSIKYEDDFAPVLSPNGKKFIQRFNYYSDTNPDMSLEDVVQLTLDRVGPQYEPEYRNYVPKARGKADPNAPVLSAADPIEESNKAWTVIKNILTLNFDGEPSDALKSDRAHRELTESEIEVDIEERKQIKEAQLKQSLIMLYGEEKAEEMLENPGDWDFNTGEKKKLISKNWAEVVKESVLRDTIFAKGTNFLLREKTANYIDRQRSLLKYLEVGSPEYEAALQEIQFLENNLQTGGQDLTNLLKELGADEKYEKSYVKDGAGMILTIAIDTATLKGLGPIFNQAGRWLPGGRWIAAAGQWGPRWLQAAHGGGMYMTALATTHGSLDLAMKNQVGQDVTAEDLTNLGTTALKSYATGLILGFSNNAVNNVLQRYQRIAQTAAKAYNRGKSISPQAKQMLKLGKTLGFDNKIAVEMEKFLVELGAFSETGALLDGKLLPSKEDLMQSALLIGGFRLKRWLKQQGIKLSSSRDRKNDTRFNVTQKDLRNEYKRIEKNAKMTFEEFVEQYEKTNNIKFNKEYKQNFKDNI